MYEAVHLDGRTDHIMLLIWGGWFWCSHWSCQQLLEHAAVGVGVVVTPPLESARGLCPKHEGVSENAIVTESKCSARRRLMEANLRVELRRRGLSAMGLKEDLIKRLGTDGRGSSCAVVRQVALGLEAGAIGWIVEAGKEKSVHNGERGAISDARRRSTRLNDLG